MCCILPDKHFILSSVEGQGWDRSYLHNTTRERNPLLS